MSEIKGIDQIFPKKSPEESAKSNLRLWAIAGVVAVFAAGYAFVPSATPKPAIESPVVKTTLPSLPKPVQQAVIQTPVAKARQQVVEKKPWLIEDRRTTRKTETAKTEVAQSAPEVKAAVKSPGRSCDCETAELSLPSLCVDASCRQCKASCGIPGN